jgi:hypothetical protein
MSFSAKSVGGVEGAAVMRHILVGMAQRPFEPGELKRRDLVPRGDLDRVEFLFARPQIKATAARTLLTTKRGVKCTVRGSVEPSVGGKLHESTPKWFMAMI